MREGSRREPSSDGGGEGVRTPDLRNAIATRYQLRHAPRDRGEIAQPRGACNRKACAPSAVLPSAASVRRFRSVFSLVALLLACRGSTDPAATPAPSPTVLETPQPQATGGARVSGRVTLEGKAPPVVTRAITVDREMCEHEAIVDRAMVVDAATGGIRYAVVTLDAGIAQPWPREIDHARCDYFPYVTIAAPGAPVTVRNTDAGLHDLHLVRAERASSVHHTMPPGRSVTLSFDTPQRVQLACDLHYWSRGWVVVTPAAFTAVTNREGHFSFEGVPPGTHTLTVWQERLGERTVEVTVPDEAARVTADVALEAPPPVGVLRTPPATAEPSPLATAGP